MRYAMGVLLLCCLHGGSVGEAKVVYVDAGATGNGSGSDWANACTTITAGLAFAATADRVWVKSATYEQAITLKEDVALYGGFPVDGSPTFEARDWDLNTTTIDASGAGEIAIVAADYVIIDGLTVTGGEPEFPVQVGGIDCDGCDGVEVVNCVVRENGGDGVHFSASSGSVRNCTVVENSGSGFAGWNSSVLVEDCVIARNVDDAHGGGISCRDCTVDFVRCVIGDNVVDYCQGAGAAVYADNGSMTFENCVVSHNLSRSNGWLFAQDDAIVVITNCTLVDNGGGMQMDPDLAAPWLDFRNCIIWNRGEEFESVPDDRINVRYCCIRSGWPGEANCDAYPLFVDPGVGDYRLQDHSPCIDRGSPDLAPATDLDGRIRDGGDGLVDIGAYEAPDEYGQGPCGHTSVARYVRGDAPPGGDGSSWEDALSTIGEALFLSGRGDEILVASATYAEPVEMSPDTKLMGGFSGTAPVRWDVLKNTTVIDATGWNTHAVRIADGCLLRGFTIMNGAAAYGSGIYGVNASATLEYCTISQNSEPTGCSWNAGGGIFWYRSSPTILDCTVEANYAYDGGGMLISESSTEVARCVFRENISYRGGGVYCWDGSARFSNSVFVDNVATGWGSGAYLVETDVSIRNSLFALNFQGQGAIGSVGGSLGLLNCTLAHNYPGGVYLEGSALTMTNCISANYIGEILGYGTPPPMVTYSCIRGGWPGDGNIDQDPDWTWWRLNAGSPCIDAGSNEAAAGILTDLDGNVRIWDGDDVPGAVVDMGAYEFGSKPPTLLGDTDGNCVVNGLDLFFFSRWWQQAENETNFRCDCVDDDVIDEYDLHRLMMDW